MSDGRRASTYLVSKRLGGGAACDDLLAVRKNDEEAPVIVGPQVLHGIEVHDVGSVDLGETVGVKAGGELCEAHVQEKRSAGCMDLGVVAARLYPQNRCGRNRDD